LSLNLLIDEDSLAKHLVNLLRQAGHDVITVQDINFMGKPDSVVLDYARENQRILLTRNCDDFHNLHQANSHHSGILSIYQAADFSKNMSYAAIVKAITNLEDYNYDLNNQFIILNQWNY
jgi:predicted nuclease of predicted toxin-antitoxin system